MVLKTRKPGEGLFWSIAIVLLILWLAGLLTHIGGPVVHVLPLIALVLIIYRLAKGRRMKNRGSKWQMLQRVH